MCPTRPLAKALGYDNPDVFYDLKFIEGVLKFFEDLKAMHQKNLDDQHPDHVRIKAQAFASGAEAMRLPMWLTRCHSTFSMGLQTPPRKLRPAAVTTCKS
jgi:hypothetical protein